MAYAYLAMSDSSGDQEFTWVAWFCTNFPVFCEVEESYIGVCAVCGCGGRGAWGGDCVSGGAWRGMWSVGPPLPFCACRGLALPLHGCL